LDNLLNLIPQSLIDYADYFKRTYSNELSKIAIFDNLRADGDQSLSTRLSAMNSLSYELEDPTCNYPEIICSILNNEKNNFKQLSVDIFNSLINSESPFINNLFNS